MGFAMQQNLAMDRSVEVSALALMSSEDQS